MPFGGKERKLVGVSLDQEFQVWKGEERKREREKRGREEEKEREGGGGEEEKKRRRGEGLTQGNTF